MKEEDRIVIREQIAPRLATGDLSLLLGAGFSIANKAGSETLPNGEDLKNRFLAACGKTAGPKTTLKDAYKYALRELPDFDRFFASCFAVEEVFPWQRRIFEYTWTRIYTTNVDNVLNVALETTEKHGNAAGDFRFFNYIDEGLISETIGSIPIVTMHGTCLRFSDGFVFSSLEYARATNRFLDWHNDLAARILAGGMVVVGNQLEESDFDSYLMRRQETYGGTASNNWIVGPNPDEIKADNLRSAGFYVIDATADEFFGELFSQVKAKSVGELLIDKVPSAQRIVKNKQAVTWFKSAFSLVFEKIEKATTQKGILRHYISGSDPEWFYIVNEAHAITERGKELTGQIANLMGSNAEGVGLLHVIGPSGSGKTTAIRNALMQIVRSYRLTYEFEPEQSMEKGFFRNIVENISAKSIFVFYSASDFYFAIKEVADLLHKRTHPFCLFILEDRTSEYQKNKRHLYLPTVTTRFVEFGSLEIQDAKNIAQKMEDVGLKFDKFSEYKNDVQARIILDKEKGFGGDLLSALFSLTTHENFEKKLFEDYEAAGNGLPRKVLDVVAIVHSLGFRLPMDYVAGALHERVEEVAKCATEDLAGIVVVPPETSVIRCRHRVIANYYFNNHIASKGDVEMLVGILEFLSRQFTVDDIRFHPLPYRIYTELISFEFLYENFFPKNGRRENCERLYHEAQRFFGTDGIFWLHFGRFYRKVGRLDQSIDCFRTGLEFYDSYQTRHQLGLALVESYLKDGDVSHYEEGVAILDAERLARGVRDSYPIATLLQLLTKVLRQEPTHEDALKKAKECINFGMRHFRNESFFSQVASDYMKLGL